MRRLGPKMIVALKRGGIEATFDNWTIATYAGGNWYVTEMSPGKILANWTLAGLLLGHHTVERATGPKFVSRSRIEVVTSSKANSHTSYPR